MDTIILPNIHKIDQTWKDTQWLNGTDIIYTFLLFWHIHVFLVWKFEILF